VRLKDVVTCRGRVLSKGSKDDVHTAELEVWARTSAARRCRGKARSALPSRH